MKKIAFAGLVLITSAAFAQEGQNNRTITGSVLQPEPTVPDSSFVDSIKLAPGFKITVFADKLMNSRVLAVNPKTGDVYVSRREQGDLLLIKDTNNDGKADSVTPVAQRPKLHGIAIHNDQLFFTTVADVYVSTIAPDGTLKDIQRIIDDLPDGGQHQNRTLAVGPDNKLYISCGSTCNTCEESNPESATMLQASLDGKQRMIYASGLRNTIGFDWHPKTGQLWGMDHGIDWLGEEIQPEELNQIDKGKRYGWPYIYADGKFTPERQPSDGTSQETWKKLSTEPTLMYTSHAAPMQMAFYEGDALGAEFKGDAFIAMRGSWNRKPPAGYEVLRIHYNDAGKPEKFESFASGWLQGEGDNWKQYGRLCGLAVAKDGSLLVSDDKNGVIYRIAKDAASTASR